MQYHVAMVMMYFFVSDLVDNNNLVHHGWEEELVALVDWQYWVCRELLNVYRTLREDVAVARRVIQNHSPLLGGLVGVVGKVLVDNVESVRREMWEERNGAEVFEGLVRFLNNNRELFLSYYGDVTKGVVQGKEDKKNYYLSGGEVLLRVGAFIEYLHFNVCRPFKDHHKGVLKLNEAVKSCRVSNKVAMDANNFLITNDVVSEFKLSSTVAMGEFKRLGVLLKLCRRRGLQNRLFFLFRDVFGYGTRVSSAGGFRLHGLLRTSELEVETDSHVDMVPHSFVVNVTTGNKVLVLAAFNDKDKKGWVDDLRWCIKRTDKNSLSAIAVTAYSSSTEEIIDDNPILPQQQTSSLQQQQQQQQQRANSVLHVCWHRNLTVTAARVAGARNCQLSGYLLRKFKNSPGWQRLWVVYANVCLYFYKSHHNHNSSSSGGDESEVESCPLASLPLLGYRVGVPEEEEDIRKEHVFKLFFKNHVYFFRADSQFTFLRWKHTLESSTHP